MTKAFTPAFTSIKKIDVIFSTNNPLGEDRYSDAVKIMELGFNERTRTIEAECSDKRTRLCRIDRITDQAVLKQLTKDLQSVYDNGTLVQFIAAGGNDANVWFYNIAIAE